MNRLHQIAVAADQLGNALLAGWADETLSARAHRMRHSGKRRWAVAHKVINAIFFWQDDHCRHSYESEVLRRHLPPEYRTEQE